MSRAVVAVEESGPLTRAEAALLALTPLAPWLGWMPGGMWVVPLVAPLTLLRPFWRRVRVDAIGSAWRLAMLWALLLAAGVTILTFVAPSRAGGAIVNGEPYRLEMFRWIATGVGIENEPARFVPQHLLHFTVFLLLTTASAGYLGLALGAALLDYMAYFVAAYARDGATLAGLVVAWVPWSVIRVCAFVLFGALAARPLLLRQRWPFARHHVRFAALGFAGILADLLLKAAIAPAYGRFLRQLAAVALPVGGP